MKTALEILEEDNNSTVSELMIKFANMHIEKFKGILYCSEIGEQGIFHFSKYSSKEIDMLYPIKNIK